MCLHITGVFRALCDVAPPQKKKKKILRLSGSGYPAYLPNKAKKKKHINLLSI